MMMRVGMMIGGLGWSGGLFFAELTFIVVHYLNYQLSNTIHSTNIIREQCVGLNQGKDNMMIIRVDRAKTI